MGPCRWPVCSCSSPSQGRVVLGHSDVPLAAPIHCNLQKMVTGGPGVSGGGPSCGQTQLASGGTHAQYGGPAQPQANQGHLWPCVDSFSGDMSAVLTLLW